MLELIQVSRAHTSASVAWVLPQSDESPVQWGRLPTKPCQWSLVSLDPFKAPGQKMLLEVPVLVFSGSTLVPSIGSQGPYSMGYLRGWTPSYNI